MVPTEKKERKRYYPGRGQSLSTAILKAIEDQKGEDLTEADFRLYDDIDPDALDNLFRKNTTGDTTVEFVTDDVTVMLRGDGGVEIQVVPRDTDA